MLCDQTAESRVVQNFCVHHSFIGTPTRLKHGKRGCTPPTCRFAGAEEESYGKEGEEGDGHLSPGSTCREMAQKMSKEHSCLSENGVEWSQQWQCMFALHR
mmetsp:Transcript_17762/g.36087  ORF Transcript_17762/g.36087 Transcript_17762/m.36087 type:complete len:101 (-) Transcript_17762:18-320(-)